MLGAETAEDLLVALQKIEDVRNESATRTYLAKAIDRSVGVELVTEHIDSVRFFRL